MSVSVLSADIFFDNQERAFVPYKGWCIVGSNGEYIKDELTINDTGPLEIIPDPLGHGNYHTLNNILKSSGEKILQKGVRNITYFSEGYYLVKDNNEDELINRYGCIPVADYSEKANVVLSNGIILSDEWFDQVYPLVNGYFLVKRNGKSNLMDMNGKLLLESFEKNLCNFSRDVAYSFHEGIMYAHSKNGEHAELRHLELLPDNGLFQTRHFNPSCGKDIKLLLSQSREGLNVITDKKSGLKNLIDNEGYLLLQKWYNDIKYAYYTPGFYFVKENDCWKYIDLAENILNDIGYDNVYTLNSTFCIVEKKSVISVIDSMGNVIKDNYTSAMYSHRGVWNVQLIRGNIETSYLSGASRSIIGYAQALLTSQKGRILLEKDNIWYRLENDGSLTTCFKYAPERL